MAKLFSKEKDIFLKIINSILVLWLIAAIVITFGVGIKLINKDTISTYEDYSKEVCMLDRIPVEEIDTKNTEKNCKESYKIEKANTEKMNKSNTDNFLIGLANVVIVSLFISILNKKSK